MNAQLAKENKSLKAIIKGDFACCTEVGEGRRVRLLPSSVVRPPRSL